MLFSEPERRPVVSHVFPPAPGMPMLDGGFILNPLYQFTTPFTMPPHPGLPLMPWPVEKQVSRTIPMPYFPPPPPISLQPPKPVHLQNAPQFAPNAPSHGRPINGSEHERGRSRTPSPRQRDRSQSPTPRPTARGAPRQRLSSEGRVDPELRAQFWPVTQDGDSVPPTKAAAPHMGPNLKCVWGKEHEWKQTVPKSLSKCQYCDKRLVALVCLKCAQCKVRIHVKCRPAEGNTPTKGTSRSHFST